MAGGMAPPPKQEELQPHPVKDLLPRISCCITSPPPWSILLGFQHYLVMLGMTVLIPTFLVPQMGGANTLFQTFFGTRLPDMINASYTFGPTTVSIVLAGRYSDTIDPQEKFEKIMQGIQGVLIVALTLQNMFGFSGLWCNNAKS